MIPEFDFHVHTHYSDGLSEPVEMVEAATARGLRGIAITDHGPELSVGISPTKIEQMMNDVEIVNGDADIPVLLGIEANIIGLNGEIDIDEEILNRLDVVVGGLHNLASSAQIPKALAKDYLNTVMNTMKLQKIDILAHPFWFHEDLSKYLSQEDMEDFAKLAVRTGIAIELNTKYHSPSREVLTTCLREGVKLSLGTDAHTPSEVGDLTWQMSMIKKIGAKKEDLVLEEFL
ncbi:hypothetical protein AKJ42_02595 [candidate division MSBL1 archaeon SCGC-AAA261C02]|nr:hypothetical protein AKJ42_02595 [candidate division MSBL1 archaeon SCGC-AAA261C02]